MSKRNRNKFRNYSARSEERTAFATASAAPTRSASGLAGAQAQHAAEYKVITSDMIRLVILNGIMLIAVLALYYANRSSGIVDRIYSQLF